MLTIEQVKQDFKFFCICYKYGLNSDEVMLHNGIIIIPALKKGTYFFLNDQFEVIEIHSQRDELSKFSLFDLADKYKDKYEYKDNEKENYPYPCEHLSMKDIYELGRNIQVEGYEYGYSTLKFNGKEIKDENNEILNILYYIKLLYDAIKEYTEYSFKAAMNYYSHPTITNYIYRLMESINQIIEEQARLGKTIKPKDILSYVGITNGAINNYFEVLYIIELICKKNGYHFEDGTVVLEQNNEPSNIDELLNTKPEEKVDITRFDIDIYLANKIGKNEYLDTEKADFDKEDLNSIPVKDISTYVRDIPQELFDERDFGPEDLDDTTPFSATYNHN